MGVEFAPEDKQEESKDGLGATEQRSRPSSHNLDAIMQPDRDQKQKCSKLPQQPNHNTSVRTPHTPMTIQFSYSGFGSKLILPYINATAELGKGKIMTGRSDDDDNVTFIVESYIGSTTDRNGPRCDLNNSKLFAGWHYYDAPELRIEAEMSNDRFTPRIRWSKAFLRTLWQGARVS